MVTCDDYCHAMLYMTCYDCGLLSAWVCLYHGCAKASFPVVWCHIFIALVARAQRGTDGPFEIEILAELTWGCAAPDSPNPPGGTSC